VWDQAPLSQTKNVSEEAHFIAPVISHVVLDEEWEAALVEVEVDVFPVDVEVALPEVDVEDVEVALPEVEVEDGFPVVDVDVALADVDEVDDFPVVEVEVAFADDPEDEEETTVAPENPAAGPDSSCELG